MGYFARICKTGVVVTALLATVVACGSDESSRARNSALVAGTACTTLGQMSKISNVSVVCAKTNTGKIWYSTMKSHGRSVVCAKPGAVRKKKSVVWVCGVAKSKKLWRATAPLPPAVLQAAVAVTLPGATESIPVLESTDVATPSRPVVADNNVLANPTIPDERPVTTVAPATTTAPGDDLSDLVMTVDTTLSIDNKVQLPLEGTYDVDVDWGDSSIESFAIGDGQTASHIYSTEGTYTIRIGGNLEHFGLPLANGSWLGVDSITSVENFGALGIKSLEGAFYGADNNIEVPGTLPATVTNLSGMFYGALKFNREIGNWNVHQVTDMSYLFKDASAFNQEISNWDVSSVLNMLNMFDGASVFNQDISNWNVGRVTNMRGMFANLPAFSPNIGNWNVSKVTNMSWMFARTGSFNGDIGSWDVSSVTTMDGMFYYVSAFNQNIGDWDVGNVTNMNVMFRGARSFNQNLTRWDVSQVTDMRFMFSFTPAFLRTNINGWAISKETNVSNMFD